MSVTISPEKKLDYLREQIQHFEAGLLTFIVCPYCGTENTPVDEYMCCILFADATAAVLDRMEKREAVDFLKAVRDKVN